ncbi:MAG: DNA-directed RNA polymerase subunit alpha [Candidatus Melainabacteria bacterium]|nr:DNA-directed RNA polymerase subunit alpha [Candidatus Melainabacteria bacterium]
MSKIEVKCLENKTNNDGSLYGKFLIEPFDRGFGTTIGNSLRRVLLSSTLGSAVTAIRIEGITHEFSSVPGVVEDVIDITLNLKGLVIKSFSDQPQTLKISAKGPKAVYAKDIILPADVQIINPDWGVATLSGDGKLEMEIIIENGVGYVPADKQKALNRAIDFIPVDSVFMPIRKVTYSIESGRTPEGADFDRVIMEIWSNGSIEPTLALGQAAAKLIEKMASIAQFSGELISIPVQVEPQKVEEVIDQRRELSIEELELSVRAYNCLKRANINSLGQLLSLSYNDLMNIKNFGRKSADEVLERLHAMGLHLSDEAIPAGLPEESSAESEAFST